MGFTQLEPGLHIRPNNIDADLAAIESHLLTLGMDKEAQVFLAQQFKPTDEEKIHHCWKPVELNLSYRKTTQELSRWIEKHKTLSLPQAARESYLMGNQAIKSIVLDPLLPAPLIDEQARATFFEAVRAFDTIGHGIWREFLSIESAMPMLSISDF